VIQKIEVGENSSNYKVLKHTQVPDEENTKGQRRSAAGAHRTGPETKYELTYL